MIATNIKVKWIKKRKKKKEQEEKLENIINQQSDNYIFFPPNKERDSLDFSQAIHPFSFFFFRKATY